MNKYLLGGLLILIIVIGFSLTSNNDQANGDQQPINQGNVIADSPIPVEPAATITIAMKDGAFEPNKIEISSGQTVTFINESAQNRWPASAIHPTHGVYPEFDPKKPIEPGQSWSFIFDKAGSWRFHDHLFPNLTGVITVK